MLNKYTAAACSPKPVVDRLSGPRPISSTHATNCSHEQPKHRSQWAAGLNRGSSQSAFRAPWFKLNGAYPSAQPSEAGRKDMVSRLGHLFGLQEMRDTSAMRLLGCNFAAS